MWCAYSAACSGITRNTDVAAAPTLKDFNTSRRDTDMLDLPFFRLIKNVFRSSPGKRRDGQRRIFVRTSYKTSAIAHEQILHIVRLAILVQRRSLGIITHADGSQFVNDLSPFGNAIRQLLLRLVAWFLCLCPDAWRYRPPCPRPFRRWTE